MGHTTSYQTGSPPQRPQMENDRRREHSATEEVHFHYQSRRGRCTFLTPLFLHTTNHHGGAAKTHSSSSSLDTPIPTTNHHGGATNTHSSLHPPHPLPISTGAPQIHTLLLWTHPCHPSYGRSTAFGLSRSLSRVQVGVAAP